MVTALNLETDSKLLEEKEKFDKLKSSRLELDSNLLNKRNQLKEDEKFNKDYTELIKKLEAEISKIEAVHKKKDEELDNEKLVNGKESKLNRNLLQKKAAL